MRVLIVFLLFVSLKTTAQDTVAYKVSDMIVHLTSPVRTLPEAADDTTAVVNRLVPAEKIESLKADPDLRYEKPVTVGESVWRGFWAWLGDQIDGILSDSFTTNIGRTFWYIVGVIAVVIIVLFILKVNAIDVFYFRRGKLEFHALEENIHEMDFEKLLREALERNDYRRAIRLLFLHALKLLADRHMIDWKPGKTNHDYARELKSQELSPGFNRLSYYFDYVWYGNFKATDAMFSRAQETFSNWRTKLN